MLGQSWRREGQEMVVSVVRTERRGEGGRDGIGSIEAEAVAAAAGETGAALTRTKTSR
jgi:hypothetical protein